MPKQQRRITYWVRAATFLLIESNQKNLLIRSEKWVFASAIPGDVVMIRATVKGKDRHCLRRIVARRRYANMYEVVEHEGLNRIAHGTKAQVLSYLARVYRAEQEEDQAVVFELAPVETEEPR